MLPYKRARGKDAMGRLKVYVGIPYDLQDAEFVSVDGAEMTRLSSNKYVTIGDVSRKLGSKF